MIRIIIVIYFCLLKLYFYFCRYVLWRLTTRVKLLYNFNRKKSWCSFDVYHTVLFYRAASSFFFSLSINLLVIYSNYQSTCRGNMSGKSENTHHKFLKPPWLFQKFWSVWQVKTPKIFNLLSQYTRKSSPIRIRCQIIFGIFALIFNWNN